MSVDRQGHLLRNIVLFARLLRALDIEVTPTQILDLLEGLRHIQLRERQDVKDTARTILINRHEYISLFDQAFDLFWQARDRQELSEMDIDVFIPEQPEQRKQEILSIQSQGEGFSPPDLDPDDDPIIDRSESYSVNEVLRQKDFVDLTPHELAEVKQLMQRMDWQLEQRRTRRKTPATHGIYYDMRRTFRQNLRYGGEPLVLKRRTRKLKRRPLVVISDISGSMERYARILLKFIYVISQGLEDAEAFVFSTRLTRITRQLRGREVDIVLDQVTNAIQDWGGGTRIGEALRTFNYDWGRRVLGQGAIVLIISDGWDRGDIALLDKEMKRLQLSCQRLIWLNPLLGSPNYQPLTRGIQAALPYIDDFLPVHNLASLEQLGELLERLSEHRPFRRQVK